MITLSRALGVFLLLGLVMTARVLTAHRPLDLAADGTMALGFVLVVSFIAGRLVSRVNLPSITGYLLVGILFGPHIMPHFFAGLTVLGPETVQSLQLLDGAALGLIALTAGGELKMSIVRQRLRSITWIIGAHLVIVITAVALVMFVALSVFDAVPDGSTSVLVACAVMLGVTAVAKSPATTIAIIQEFQPKGPLTEVVIAVTVAKDVVVVTVFTIALAAAVTVVDPGRSGFGQMALSLAWEVFGSLGLGVLAGVILAQYASRVGKEMPLLVLGVAFLSGALMEAYHLSGLLVCMVAGFWVENFSDRGEDLIHAVEKHSLPLYIIFFTIAGAALDLEALASAWPLALALVLARTFFTFLATYVAVRIAGESPVVGRYGWTGFIGQAGLTLGFASVIASRFPNMGELLSTVIIAGVALNQIAGPVLFRWGLKAAGEIPGVPARK